MAQKHVSIVTGSSSVSGRNGSNRLDGLGGPSRGDAVEWGDVNAQTLAEAVSKVLEQDGLLGFSRVSGGNAVCLYVKWGKQTVKLYAASIPELDQILNELAERFS